MCLKIRRSVLFLIPILLLQAVFLYAGDAYAILKKSENLMRSKSSIVKMRMKIIKPDWSREMQMKVWSIEPDYALVLITAPARDRGTVTLKRKKEVWNYIPSIRRTIKIPPSMMLQSWMGSDFTNDDLVRESSVLEDYTHSIEAIDTVDGYACYRIKMLPKPDAGVVWGKVMIWISQKGYMQLRARFFDEDGVAVKTMHGRRIKKIGGRILPTLWEMTPEDKPGHKTRIEYLDIQFNAPLKPTFFSQKNMKRVRP